ncbi:hypothetical protein GOP47_0030833, partial [Adiantum capillus-veneris]
LSMPRTSLRNAGTAAAVGPSRLLRARRTLLGTPLRSAEEGCLLAERRRAAGAAVVRAVSIGVVKKVEPASKSGGYFNVALNVLPGSEVVKWYKTPGQYVNILPVESQFVSPSAFFIASPPSNGTDLEFLIEDVPDTIANKLINSKPGVRVVISTCDS